MTENVLSRLLNYTVSLARLSGLLNLPVGMTFGQVFKQPAFHLRKVQSGRLNLGKVARNFLPRLDVTGIMVGGNLKLVSSQMGDS